MKKVYTTILAAAAALCAAYAQTPTESEVLGYMTDGVLWSTNDYGGTARTMGMGNAVTATGGDLGSIIINPAGSAVAPFGVVSLTPGMSLSMTKAHGTVTPDGNAYLGTNIQTNKGRFILPNIGFALNFDSGRLTGLKRFTFGFLANSTNFYNDSMMGRGINDAGTSSYAGSMASASTNGYWNDEIACASDAGIIGTHTALPEGTDIGVTECPLTDMTTELESRINQRYSHRTDGTKTDFIFNFGFNISDIVFIGANLGMQAMRYSIEESINESAYEGGTFASGFSDLSRIYSYDCSGTGIYGKFGVLVAPVDGLRIGAAIQTPTAVSISEGYRYNTSNRYAGSSKNYSAEVDNIRYGITSPFFFNVGLAYTLGTVAVLSVDYERVDYKYLKFRYKTAEDIQWFDTVNEQIQGIGIYGANRLGASNILRAGAEVKLLNDMMALRAGYNLITDGTRFYNLSGELLKSHTQSVSAGIGYNSTGSFFADIAAKYTFRPDMTYQAYADYDNRGDGASYREISAPRMATRRSALNIVATIGWRF